MKAGGFRALGLAAIMLLVAGQMATPAAAAAKATVQSTAMARDEKRIRRALRGDLGQSRYRKRDGWSVAQDRRNAAKARNVRRNRAAHRR